MLEIREAEITLKKLEVISEASILPFGDVLAKSARVKISTIDYCNIQKLRTVCFCVCLVNLSCILLKRLGETLAC